MRTKKRVAYLPPLELPNRGRELQIDKGHSERQAYTQRRIQGSLNRSAEISPRHRTSSLSDVSYMSTASSSSQKAKNRVLADSNRIRQIVPEAMIEKAVHPHSHIPLRYNESPYVLKLKQTKKERNHNDLPTDRISQLALNQRRGKSLSPKPNLFKRTNR